LGTAVHVYILLLIFDERHPEGTLPRIIVHQGTGAVVDEADALELKGQFAVAES
jgi:hypothetical protein